MTLTDKIFSLYPNILLIDFNPFNGTIMLQDDSDGHGQYIRIWNRFESKPTQEQLDAIND